MRIKILLPLMFLTVVSFAQKKNIVFQNFSMSSGIRDTTYRAALYDMILNGVIKLNKVNVVNRSPEMWKAIEKELAMQDFITPETAIRLGNMVGANYYLEGKCTQFFRDTKVKGTVNNVTTYTQVCTIDASLKLVDLESGKYEETILSSITVYNDDYNAVLQNAMHASADDLVKKLSKLFLVQGKIIKVIPPDQLVIDKGAADGVREQTPFVILSSDNTNIGTFKITTTTDHESYGRVLSGDFKSIAVSGQVRESEAMTQANVVTVESKTKNKVVINAGTNLGIEKGDVFVSKQPKETRIGDRVITEDVVTGKMYVTNVKRDFAEAKIIDGYYTITPGVVATESDEGGLGFGIIQFRYKAGLGINIKATKPSGIVSVPLDEGSYDVDTEYLSDYKDITEVSVYTFGFGWRNSVRSLATYLNVDVYRMGPLKNWILSLDWNIERPIVPEKLYLTISPELGFGGMKQEIPNNVVSIISDGESSELNATSIYLSAGVGLAYSVSRFQLNAGLSYDYMKFRNWSYEGRKDGDKKDKEPPSSIVPYNSVDLSGLYYNVSLRYQFKH